MGRRRRLLALGGVLMPKPDPKPGQRVVLRGNHPWVGYSGVVTNDVAPIGALDYPIVELDTGQRVVVFGPEQWAAC